MILGLCSVTRNVFVGSALREDFVGGSLLRILCTHDELFSGPVFRSSSYMPISKTTNIIKGHQLVIPHRTRGAKNKRAREKRSRYQDSRNHALHMNICRRIRQQGFPQDRSQVMRSEFCLFFCVFCVGVKGDICRYTNCTVFSPGSLRWVDGL